MVGELFIADRFIDAFYSFWPFFLRLFIAESMLKKVCLSIAIIVWYNNYE